MEALNSGAKLHCDERQTLRHLIFVECLDPNDAVKFVGFKDRKSELDWLAEQIETNLKSDEMDPDDILIIVSDIRSIRSFGGAVMRTLAGRSINSHIVGITQSGDEIFSKASVAITHIYRAKGNEAPMVYVVGAEHCYDGFNIGTLRNTLFTAITRSKAWVRVSGFGDQMTALISEFHQIRESEFNLEFRYPTKKELTRIKTRYREVSEFDVQRIENDLASLSRLVPLIHSGKISLSDLPVDVATAIKALRDETE